MYILRDPTGLKEILWLFVVLRGTRNINRYFSIVRKPTSMKFHRYILVTNVYKVNGVDFRFDIITSFYDVISPRHTRAEFSLD